MLKWELCGKEEKLYIYIYNTHIYIYNIYIYIYIYIEVYSQWILSYKEGAVLYYCNTLPI